jgi:hypothetical protein
MLGSSSAGSGSLLLLLAASASCPSTAGVELGSLKQVAPAASHWVHVCDPGGSRRHSLSFVSLPRQLSLCAPEWGKSGVRGHLNPRFRGMGLPKWGRGAQVREGQLAREAKARRG